MPSYTRYWQSSTNFAADFERYLRYNADDTKTRYDQMTEFAAANVDELRTSSGRRPRVVRVTLKPTITCEGHAFTQGGWSTHTGTLYCKVRCGNRQNAQQCPAAVHIPLAANAATTALGILHGEHVHQRHANDAYDESGRLTELNRLVDSCERLQAVGVDIKTLVESGKRPHSAQDNDEDVKRVLQSRALFYEHFASFEPDEKNVGVAYCKLHARVNESSSLREKVNAVRYYGQRITTKIARAATNNKHDIGARLVRVCGGQTIGHVELHTQLPQKQAKRAETMMLGLHHGNHKDADYPLANINPGETFALLANNTETDKLVAAYLLVSGLILGAFSTETLKNVEWKTLYEETNAKLAELTQKYIELEAQNAALELQLADSAQ